MKKIKWWRSNRDKRLSLQNDITASAAAAAAAAANVTGDDHVVRSTSITTTGSNHYSMMMTDEEIQAMNLSIHPSLEGSVSVAKAIFERSKSVPIEIPLPDPPSTPDVSSALSYTIVESFGATDDSTDEVVSRSSTPSSLSSSFCSRFRSSIGSGRTALNTLIPRRRMSEIKQDIIDASFITAIIKSLEITHRCETARRGALRSAGYICSTIEMDSGDASEYQEVITKLQSEMEILKTLEGTDVRRVSPRRKSLSCHLNGEDEQSVLETVKVFVNSIEHVRVLA